VTLEWAELLEACLLGCCLAEGRGWRRAWRRSAWHLLRPCRHGKVLRLILLVLKPLEPGKRTPRSEIRMLKKHGRARDGMGLFVLTFPRASTSPTELIPRRFDSRIQSFAMIHNTRMKDEGSTSQENNGKASDCNSVGGARWQVQQGLMGKFYQQ